MAGPRRVHQGWPTRREAITSRLKAEAPDIAAYQDLWREEDLEVFAQATQHTFRAANPSLGLAITSRWPVIASSSIDLGRGFGTLRARLSDHDRYFDVYSIRLEPGEGLSSAWRLGQMFRLAQFVREQSPNSPFVLLGDLAEGSDEREISLFIDLLELRDLCVFHGDEVCGRTLGDRRIDYAFIPYSPREPKQYARTTFTDLSSGDDSDAPTPQIHFGLRAQLDQQFIVTPPRATGVGRQEALSAITDRIELARLQEETLMQASGWIPFYGASQSIIARRNVLNLSALLEELHTAQIIPSESSTRPDPRTPSSSKPE